MRRREESGGPAWWGPPAGTNGPGRLDERRYDQNASFMTNLSPASCPFTIGSAVPCKNIKKTQPANLGGMPITCGTLLHKRPLIDVDPLELERRAEYDRRAAFDTRAELVRREEYDRRLVYDRRNQIALCHDEEWKAQENRFTQMEKIIETLTAMFMKPSQPHPEVEAEKPTKTVNQHSHSQTKFPLRKVRRIPRPDMKARLGCDRAREDEHKVRKILKICRKAAEEGLVGTLHVADALAHVPRELTRGAEGKEAGLQKKEKAIQKRRLRKISRLKRAGEYWIEGSLTQENSDTRNKKQRQHKQVRTLARVLGTSDPKLRTKIKYNNNGGKTEGVSDSRGVMSLKICMYSTKRERMKLSTLVTKRASKKGQDIRSSTRCMKDKNEQKDWWKTLSNSKRNWKRKSLQGSTDVYLLKRTIELEID